MIEYEYYLLGFAGVLLHFLTKLYEARINKNKIDWILELIASVISVIIVMVFVYSKKDLESLYPLTMVTSIILGYSAQSILRSIIKATQPKNQN